MRQFLSIFPLILIVSARPDIGLQLRQQGYNYASSSSGGGGGGGGSYQQQRDPVINQGIGYLQTQTSGSGFGTTGTSSQQHVGTTGLGTQPISGTSGYGSQQTFGGAAQTPNLSPEITKNYYAFAGEDENVPAAQIIQEQNLRPKVNYKVIFIKAPNYNIENPHVLAQHNKVEEKTLVYVLSKKPDHLQPIHLSQQTDFKPSKPEVFFIKYKAKGEAQGQVQPQVQDEGVQQDSGPVSRPDLNAHSILGYDRGQQVTRPAAPAATQGDYLPPSYKKK